MMLMFLVLRLILATEVVMTVGGGHYEYERCLGLNLRSGVSHFGRNLGLGQGLDCANSFVNPPNPSS